MSANGINEALHRIADVEDEAAKERRYVRDQFRMLRGEMAHLTEMVGHANATLDILLKMAHADEKRHEAESG